MANFQSLVDMQERSCEQFSANRLFGTKRAGVYQWLTYAEFATLVNHFRAALAALGVGAGDKVAAISNNRVEWAVGAYATYGLGANYVPMYEAQLPKEWKFILEDSEAVVLLVSSEAIFEKVKGFAGTVGRLRSVVCFDAPANLDHSYDAQLKLGSAKPVPSIAPSADDIAGLIYTSGTTGEPKGVILTHGNFVSNVNAVHALFPMTPSDSSLSFLPWAHSFGQTCELHCMLSMGAAIGLAESVATLIDNLSEVRPTILFSVPRIFNRIYDGLQKKMADESAVKRTLFYQGLATAKQRRELADQGQSSSWIEIKHAFFDKLVFSKVRERLGGRLKYAFSGGAALSPAVAEFIDDVGIIVFEGYGLSETSPIVTANSPEARRIGTVGKPIEEVVVEIIDPATKQILPKGEEGEVVVSGPNVMLGYHNRDKATADVIYEQGGKRFFCTGDKGRFDRDGFLKITGRIKEQYKLENGKYVVPAPLEEQLKLSGFVNQVFIYGMNRPYNVALVVPDMDACTKWASSQGLDLDSPERVALSPEVHAKIGDELMSFGAQFKGYERPKRWALLSEEFSPENEMLTPTLKLKRRKVLERYQVTLDALYAGDGVAV